MNRFLRWGLWALTAAGCLALCLTGAGSGLAVGQAAAFPFAPVGRWLRSLSLSGPAGNAAALALYGALSLLPLVLLIPLRRQPVREDWLLGLAVPVGLGVWWCAVNPGWLFPASEAMELACLGGAFWMLMLCWALLRWLRRGGSPYAGLGENAAYGESGAFYLLRGLFDTIGRSEQALDALQERLAAESETREKLEALLKRVRSRA